MSPTKPYVHYLTFSYIPCTKIIYTYVVETYHLLLIIDDNIIHKDEDNPMISEEL